MAEVPAGLPTHPLEAHAPLLAQRKLGEVAHRHGDALLATVPAVQRAHRHAGGPRQLLRPHVVVAPLPQQHRGLPHGVGVDLFLNPHAPSPPRRSGRPSWNEPSFHDRLYSRAG
jgi:hypothetical protein